MNMKLDRTTRLEILDRLARGERQVDLAEEYEVNQSTISRIKTKREVVQNDFSA